MTSTSSRLLARLYRDLAELQEQPYPGVAVFIDDADIRKICLVLTPPAGPWKGLALHFDVVLPPSWVSTLLYPPRAIGANQMAYIA
jgi:ubiquitin-protein ligase